MYDIFGYPMGNPLRRASIVDLYLDESRRNMELARAEMMRGGRLRRSLKLMRYAHPATASLREFLARLTESLPEIFLQLS